MASFYDFCFCEKDYASAVSVGFCVAAELLAYHYGFGDGYVFGGVVHLYYHINAYCAVPVA